MPRPGPPPGAPPPRRAPAPPPAPAPLPARLPPYHCPLFLQLMLPLPPQRCCRRAASRRGGTPAGSCGRSERRQRWCRPERPPLPPRSPDPRHKKDPPTPHKKKPHKKTFEKLGSSRLSFSSSVFPLFLTIALSRARVLALSLHCVARSRDLLPHLDADAPEAPG